MFFCPELLQKKGHPLFLVWMAATQNERRLKTYLPRRKMATLDVNYVINDILKRIIVTSSIPRQIAMQNGCLSLYLSSRLMYGCCVILHMKASALMNDLSTISKTLRAMKYSSDKSQMVLKPKKNKVGKWAGENQLQWAESGRKKPDAFDNFSLDESIEVDDTPIVYTNSVSEHLITMVEVDVSPRTIEQVKDLLFGDEHRRDGGAGFISFLNGNYDCLETFQEHNSRIGASEGHVGSITLEEAITADAISAAAHFDVPEVAPQLDKPSIADEISGATHLDVPETPAELDEANIADAISTAAHLDVPEVAPQLDRPSIADEIYGATHLDVPETPAELDEANIADAISTAAHLDVPEVAPQLDRPSIADEIYEATHLDVPETPAELDEANIADAISTAAHLDVPEVAPQLDKPSIADEISEPTHLTPPLEESPPELDQPMPAAHYDIAPETSAGQEPDMIPSVLPESDQMQSTLLADDNNVLELPELLEEPQKKKRKRNTHLIIDERTEIPASLREKRIRDGARDTIRNISSFEDSMLMLLTANKLNLDAMRQSGRFSHINRIHGPLDPLFSRHCVTHSVPNDDRDFNLDETFNQSTGTNETENVTLNREQSATEVLNSLPAGVSAEIVPEIPLTPPGGPRTPASLTLIGFGDERNQDILADYAENESLKRIGDDLENHQGEPSPKRQKTAETDPKAKAVEKVQDESAIETVGIAESGANVQDNSNINKDLLEILQGQSPREDVPVVLQDQILQEQVPQENVFEIFADLPCADASEFVQDSETGLMKRADTTPQSIPDHSFTNDLQEQIQPKTVEVPGLRDENQPINLDVSTRADVGQEGKAPQDSVSDSSVKSLGSSVVSQEVYSNAAQLACERNGTKIPIADLCPPSKMKRLKAACNFSVLLDLHKKKHVTLHQDRTVGVGPISFTVNDILPSTHQAM